MWPCSLRPAAQAWGGPKCLGTAGNEPWPRGVPSVCSTAGTCSKTSALLLPGLGLMQSLSASTEGMRSSRTALHCSFRCYRAVRPAEPYLSPSGMRKVTIKWLKLNKMGCPKQIFISRCFAFLLLFPIIGFESLQLLNVSARQGRQLQGRKLTVLLRVSWLLWSRDFGQQNTCQGMEAFQNECYYIHIFVFLPAILARKTLPSTPRLLKGNEAPIFLSLQKCHKDLRLPSINHSISSLLEVSCGLMNKLWQLVTLQELEHPSGLIQTETSMGASQLPQFATTNCSLTSAQACCHSLWAMLDAHQACIRFKVAFQNEGKHRVLPEKGGRAVSISYYWIKWVWSTGLGSVGTQRTSAIPLTWYFTVNTKSTSFKTWVLKAEQNEKLQASGIQSSNLPHITSGRLRRHYVNSSP